MLAVVPSPLAHVAGLLGCPVCALPLTAASGTLRCERGHAYDVARHGYVTLGPPSRRPVAGDSAAMVAARAAVLGAGLFAPLTAALVDLARSLVARDGVVLDVGAGTGHHLAAVLDALPDARGIALDASRSALRRAARAHPRMAAIVADVWRRIPLQDAAVDLVLNVFAPRNAAEFVRVLRPGGALIVATPAPEHLRELAPLHAVRVDARKPERLQRQLAPLLSPADRRRIVWSLRLTRDEVRAVVSMGPAARHLAPDVEQRVAALRAPVAVTAAVDVGVWLASRAV